MTLHETHVCRDCGAEITVPYVREYAEGDLRLELLAGLDAIEPCCDDVRVGDLRAMCQHGAYVRDAVRSLIEGTRAPADVPA